MFFDLPTMQTCRPNVSKLHLFKISITPAGVAGRRYGLPELNLCHKSKQPMIQVNYACIANVVPHFHTEKVPCN